MAAPGSKSGKLVGLIDLVATAADILQQPIPETAAEDSVSLLPILRGRNVPIRTTQIHHSLDGCFAVRQGTWKLALCAGSGGWSSPREVEAAERHLPQVQLYDIASDAGENHNVASEHPEIVKQLTHVLEKAIADGRTTEGKVQKNDVAVNAYKRMKK